MRPSWTDDTETLAMILHHYAKRSIRLPLALQRMMVRPLPPSEVSGSTRLERTTARGVPVGWFERRDSDRERVIFYLHGGGYVLGSIDSHSELCARLCHSSGARLLSVDYRLAPEHRFPCQLEDAVSTYRWLLDQGVEASRVVIGGDSAGGGLTLSTLVKLRDEGIPLPAGAFFISPWIDLEATGCTHDNAQYDYICLEVLQAYARLFAGEHQLRDPLAAPLFADLAGLPPMLVHAGGAEVLLDDAQRLAARAEAAGVPVELAVWQDMIHAWHVFAHFLEEAREAIDQLGAWTRYRQGSA